MTGGGDAGMQLIYMEVEGIKIAYQMSKDAVKILWQLAKYILCSLKDAPYKKTSGKTNLKNLQARSGGQPLTAFSVDKETYKYLEKDLKKHGVLFKAFHPLRSGKHGSVEILISEKDIAMVQELLSRYKEKRVKEDVKNGMSKEQSEQNFAENNRTESMEEFAEHVGATAPEEEFEAGMKERFGENYEENIIQFEKAKEKHAPKSESAGESIEKAEHLAEVINFKERADKLKKEAPIEIQFVYDAKNGKSQILDETEKHVKIAGRGIGISDNKEAWECLWVPKENILPPLDQEPEEGGIRRVRLRENADVIVEDPTGKKAPENVKAEKLNYGKEWNPGSFVAEKKSYQTVQPKKYFDITIGKTYLNENSSNKKAPAMIWAENERAIKTRVPGTYGDHMKFLWIEKKDLQEAYDGKSLLTSLSADKDYKIYSEDNRVVGTIKGNELYLNHYDRVNKNVRKNAQPMAAMKGRGRNI